ncbi:hypothetical protein H2201_006362 [Coniosporium apollinis]|uniref:Major facilitator superfamily (MFS) profile domain-containing protein n=1 Tax=Coniosporium apollinis TaxID=61459 RepID=A0ABQ9NMG9_9PEZI|nr:hypothetical protein H2201_006362 [Coniosporium apollinis]
MREINGDAAGRPLMQGDEGLQHPQDFEYDTDELDGSEVLEESALKRPTPFIWALTFAAGVSGLLFGYDTGVISSTLVSINADLSARPLTTLDKSLITSCTSLAALLASPLTGVLADHFGRKKVILAADVLFVAGAAWQALTTSVWGMIGGRSVVGLGIGGASMVVPLYISESSPSPFRGRLVTVSSLLITGGQVVAYVIGFLFSATPGGWRWMVGLGALPAVLQILMLGFMPESPRWLVKAGRADEGRRVLGRIYGGAGDGNMNGLVEGVVRRVEREIIEEEEELGGELKGGWKGKLEHLGDGFRELVAVGANRRALVIACMLQGFQQLCGFNALMYFSATIFSLCGFASPTLTSLSIASTNFAFTIAAFYAIDRVGRRRILLLSVPVMVLGLLLCSLAFGFIDLGVPSAVAGAETAESGASRGEGQAGRGPWPLVLLASLILYVSAYALGLGVVPWQQSELFVSVRVRALGSALATATNWGSNFVVGLTFLPLMEAVGPVTTFALYAVVCVVGWGGVWRIYPETAGLGIEDVGGLLRDGWGVESSVRGWEERKRARRRVQKSREGS